MLYFIGVIEKLNKLFYNIFIYLCKFDSLMMINRLSYLRDNSVIFLKVHIELRDCDLDVGLKFQLGEEA